MSSQPPQIGCTIWMHDMDASGLPSGAQQGLAVAACRYNAPLQRAAFAGNAHVNAAIWHLVDPQDVVQAVAVEVAHAEHKL